MNSIKGRIKWAVILLIHYLICSTIGHYLADHFGAYNVIYFALTLSFFFISLLLLVGLKDALIK